MKSGILSLIILLFVFNVVAEEELPIGSFNGTNVQLTTYDHAFAGVIDGGVAWGFLDEENGVSRIVFRKEGQTVEAVFERNEAGKLGGLVGANERAINIEFAGIDRDNNLILFDLNGVRVNVTMIPEDFRDGHFINPEFSMLLNGEEVKVKLIGEGCYSLAIHYVMMLMGAYAY